MPKTNLSSTTQSNNDDDFYLNHPSFHITSNYTRSSYIGTRIFTSLVQVETFPEIKPEILNCPKKPRW